MSIILWNEDVLFLSCGFSNFQIRNARPPNSATTACHDVTDTGPEPGPRSPMLASFVSIGCVRTVL